VPIADKNHQCRRIPNREKTGYWVPFLAIRLAALAGPSNRGSLLFGSCPVPSNQSPAAQFLLLRVNAPHRPTYDLHRRFSGWHYTSGLYWPQHFGKAGHDAFQRKSIALIGLFNAQRLADTASIPPAGKARRTAINKTADIAGIGNGTKNPGRVIHARQTQHQANTSSQHHHPFGRAKWSHSAPATDTQAVAQQTVRAPPDKPPNKHGATNPPLCGIGDHRKTAGSVQQPETPSAFNSPPQFPVPEANCTPGASGQNAGRWVHTNRHHLTQIHLTGEITIGVQLAQR